MHRRYHSAYETSNLNTPSLFTQTTRILWYDAQLGLEFGLSWAQLRSLNVNVCQDLSA